MSLQKKPLTYEEFREIRQLRLQKSQGGGLYTCACCKKQYAGGRYGFRANLEGIDLEGFEQTEVHLFVFCPTCWPTVLTKLEAGERSVIL